MNINPKIRRYTKAKNVQNLRQVAPEKTTRRKSIRKQSNGTHYLFYKHCSKDYRSINVMNKALSEVVSLFFFYRSEFGLIMVAPLFSNIMEKIKRGKNRKCSQSCYVCNGKKMRQKKLQHPQDLLKMLY